jgi:hypothetical protein
MPNTWNITSVETKGNYTNICGISPDGKKLLYTSVQKMTLDELLRNEPQMWEKHEKRNDSREGHSITIVNRDECYTIGVSLSEYDGYNKQYLDRVYGDSKVLDDERARYERKNKETNAICEEWSKLPFVNIHESSKKNVVCDKFYLGLPVIVYMHWYGQVTATI